MKSKCLYNVSTTAPILDKRTNDYFRKFIHFVHAILKLEGSWHWYLSCLGEPLLIPSVAPLYQDVDFISAAPSLKVIRTQQHPEKEAAGQEERDGGHDSHEDCHTVT